MLGCDNHAGKALFGPRHTGCHDTMLVCTHKAFVQQRQQLDGLKVGIAEPCCIVNM
jgi:hypothetical protein